MNDIHGITAENLLRTLPIGLQEDEAMQGLAASAAEALAGRTAEIRRLLIYPNIGELDEELLDILAYDFKVDWWDGDYSPAEKRQTLKESWRVHRMMGTKAAVETAIAAIFPNSTVQEWFEYGGKPYHFKLEINTTGIVGDLEKQQRVLGRLNYYKNLRSHLEGVTYIMETAPFRLAPGGTMSTIRRTPIPEARDDYDFRSVARAGGQVSAITSMPIAEAADIPDFRGTIGVGGRSAAIASVPVPEASDNPAFVDTLRAGGRTAIATSLPIPEQSS